MNEIEKAAKISRIKLGEEETRRLEKDLKDILSYFSSIESLPKQDSTVYITERRNTFRKDDAKRSEEVV
jgi:aspartyl/glutamyl-tRNA(Asn/Gln) amidotransferase C subunit